MNIMNGPALSSVFFTSVLLVAEYSSAQPVLTPADLENPPVDKLYVRRGKALLINLSLARTAADWLKVPGVKGAWKNFGLRGKTVLQDADGDGWYELYGESPGTKSGTSSFWCRLPDGTVRWETTIMTTGGDNNGVQCEDLDGDGKHEVLSVGNNLTLLDAHTGKKKLEKYIFRDFFNPPGKEVTGEEVRFDHPYRLGHCTHKKDYDIVVANSYSPTATPGEDHGKWGIGYPLGGIQIICYKHDGSIAWRYKHVDPRYRGGGHEIRVRDIDGDGWDEVVHSANGGVICLNRDGSQRWRHDIGNSGKHSDWISIADMDGNGELDVVVQQPGCSARVGDFYIIDADTGTIKSRTPNRPLSHVQCFAAGEFRKQLPGRQLAITTKGGRMLRMIDGKGRYLTLAPDTKEPHVLRWNDMDMYNVARADGDGDGEDEMFIYSTPKGPARPVDAAWSLVGVPTAKALRFGVAAFKGDGILAQYWNFYTPSASGIQWLGFGYEMRQFQCPVRRFDVDKNGTEEAYLETPSWILLFEIPPSL